MAPCYGVLYAALAAAVLVPHVSGCDDAKLIEFGTTCPITSSIEEGDDLSGDTLQAMANEVCEDGPCKTLVDDVQTSCAGADGMEWLGVLSLMCGGCKKLMIFETACPTTAKGGDDMMAMIQEFCEPGSCSSLVKELMADCVDADEMKDINMLGAMCGSGSGKIESCPVVGNDTSMMFFALVQPCPKFMEYYISEPDDDAEVPEEVLKEFCGAGTCFDTQKKLEEVCKGNTEVEELFKEADEECKNYSPKVSFAKALARSLGWVSAVAGVIATWACSDVM